MNKGKIQQNKGFGARSIKHKCIDEKRMGKFKDENKSYIIERVNKMET